MRRFPELSVRLLSSANAWGLSAGLGSALTVDGIVEPMELAHLPYRKASPG